jgi:hypothetical protein
VVAETKRGGAILVISQLNLNAGRTLETSQCGQHYGRLCLPAVRRYRRARNQQ